MASIFRLLEDQEQQNLIETAELRRYEPGDVMLQEGEEEVSIFVILSGRVSVKREHVGFAIEIGSFGPREIFGEMSFIEGLPASATVVAEEATEAAVISNRQLLNIIRQNPEFYGRFYHSLAEILSRRLRHTSDRVADADTPWGN